MILLEREPAFVLHSRHYGETSLIVDLFTRSQGRLPVYARGARKRKKNASSGVLAPFTPLVVSTQGRGALKSLTMSDSVAAPFMLTGKYLYCGLYLNELLMRLLPEYESQAALFGSYMQLIARLAGAVESEIAAQENYLRQFEWQLIQAAGVSFSLTVEAERQQSVQAGMQYCYRPGIGLVHTDAQGQGTIGGSSLLAFATSSEQSDVERLEIKRFMRLVLKPLLGGKPLASRALFGQ